MDRTTIRDANQKAVGNMMKSDPVWIDVRTAIDVVPGMTKKTILHAGPPVEWGRMCGPVRGAIAGALILECLASGEDEAYELAASGAVAFDACHNHGCVGPMAGVISPSMPVFVIKDETFGNQTYCCLNEGRGKVLRYGGLGPEVIKRLRWMGDVLGPALQGAVRHSGPFAVKPIMAEALHMGDDLHNRYKAASSLFVNRISTHIIATAADTKTAAEVIEFIATNDYTFLNIAMPALKAIADAGDGIEASSVVTALARNGTDFGLRVSGLKGKWFTAPAPAVRALYFPGYSEKDANPDMGDSTITETTGFGGFATAASPSVVQFVGGTVEEEIRQNLEMYEICVTENPRFTIPALGFRGIPQGIDIIKVIEKNICPYLHTGVAHKNAGVGQIGAGSLRAPFGLFKDALKEFARVYMS